MDLLKVLAQLRHELEYLDEAILSLERIGKKGRPRGASPGPQLEERKPGRAARRGSGTGLQLTLGRPKRKRLT
jgi:hypothetical protein